MPTIRSEHPSKEDSNVVLEAEDEVYFEKMTEILERIPNKLPLPYPVKIAPHVYIGSQLNADDDENLRRLGISYVLNCAGTRDFDLTRSPYKKDSGIERFLMIQAQDYEDYNIIQDFSKAFEFIEKAKLNAKKVLVHCIYGINRSGAICAGYIMMNERLPLLQTIEHLKRKRNVILTNEGFRYALIKYARKSQLLDPILPVWIEEARGRLKFKKAFALREKNGIPPKENLSYAIKKPNEGEQDKISKPLDKLHEKITSFFTGSKNSKGKYEQIQPSTSASTTNTSKYSTSYSPCSKNVSGPLISTLSPISRVCSTVETKKTPEPSGYTPRTNRAPLRENVLQSNMVNKTGVFINSDSESSRYLPFVVQRRNNPKKTTRPLSYSYNEESSGDESKTKAPSSFDDHALGSPLHQKYLQYYHQYVSPLAVCSHTTKKKRSSNKYYQPSSSTTSRYLHQTYVAK